MSEVDLWPTCAECTNRQDGAWVPVEAYQLEDEGKPSPLLITPTRRVRIIARCAHGGREPRTQVATIDVPEWWGRAHLLDAIASLTFFAPGQGAPEHGLVTAIG